MPTPQLPKNNLPVVTFKRPLVGLSTARAALGLDSSGVNALIQDGTLRAFNLAGEVHYKPCLRIVAADLERMQKGSPKPTDDFARTIALLFPMAPAPRVGVIGTMKVSTVARQLNVKSETVYHLIERRLMQLVRGDKARRGPTGSARLDWNSVVAFLKKRQA